MKDMQSQSVELSSGLQTVPLSWLAVPSMPGWPHDLSPVYHLSSTPPCSFLHLHCDRGVNIICQEKEN